MRIIVVPDSFKGSLSSLQVCGIITDRLKRRGHSVVQVPVADGGEGTVEAMLLAAGGEPRTDIVQGPYGNRVCAIRGVLPGGTAVIELAQAAGLPLVGDDRRAGEATTSGWVSSSWPRSMREVMRLWSGLVARPATTAGAERRQPAGCVSWMRTEPSSFLSGRASTGSRG